jgi:RNA polymerase sigma-70 factor (ECF subfamily)
MALVSRSTAVAPVDLRELMAGYQAGDIGAFDRLYALLAPIVRRYLASLTYDRTRTDDLLQDAFLQIHRARHTYNPAYPVQPWALAIARHVFLMELRTRARKHGLEVADAAEDAQLPVASTEAALVARDRLQHALQALTPGTRRAVLLHHLWGWTFEEIGARLGIRGAAAKLRASRGMATLREELAAKQDDDGK